MAAKSAPGSPGVLADVRSVPRDGADVPMGGVNSLARPQHALIYHRDFATISRWSEGVVQQLKILSEGQRAYEAKRAAKAGMSLDKWLASKQRQQEIEAKARQKTAAPSKPPKPSGFFSRLLERASRPFGS